LYTRIRNFVIEAETRRAFESEAKSKVRNRVVGLDNTPLTVRAAPD
jgi:hypothetical protein